MTFGPWKVYPLGLHRPDLPEPAYVPRDSLLDSYEPIIRHRSSDRSRACQGVPAASATSRLRVQALAIPSSLPLPTAWPRDQVWQSLHCEFACVCKPQELPDSPFLPGWLAALLTLRTLNAQMREGDHTHILRGTCVRTYVRTYIVESPKSIPENRAHALQRTLMHTADLKRSLEAGFHELSTSVLPCMFRSRPQNEWTC